MPIDNVPASDVGDVVQAFIDNHVQRVRVDPDPHHPGRFVVTPA